MDQLCQVNKHDMKCVWPASKFQSSCGTRRAALTHKSCGGKSVAYKTCQDMPRLYRATSESLSIVVCLTSSIFRIQLKNSAD